MKPNIKDRLDKILFDYEGAEEWRRTSDTLNIFESIVTAASAYFTECPDDFCIQHIGENRVIFGGTNRLVWSPRFGFEPDKSYCTEKFLHHWETIGTLPK